MTLFTKQPLEGKPLPRGFAKWCRAVDKAICGLAVVNGHVTWSGNIPTISVDAPSSIRWKPFDVQLVWVASDAAFHVLVYMPIGRFAWMRGGSKTGNYNSATNSACAEWPINGQKLPTDWVDTGILWARGDGEIILYAWVSNGASWDITATPSLLTFDTDGNADAQKLGYQRRLAQISQYGTVTQLFDGIIDEEGATPL